MLQHLSTLLFCERPCCLGHNCEILQNENLTVPLLQALDSKHSASPCNGRKYRLLCDSATAHLVNVRLSKRSYVIAGISVSRLRKYLNTFGNVQMSLALFPVEE